MGKSIALSKSDFYFRIYFVTVMAMPFFPTIFSNSLLINYLILAFSMLTFLFFKIKDISRPLFLYFLYSLLMFFLVVASTLYSQIEAVSISSVMNFARPVFLMLATISLYALISKSYAGAYKNISFTILVLVVVYSFFAGVERFLGDAIYYIYKMHDRASVANATVSIYMFNYYSSYINTVFLILAFSFFMMLGKKKYLIVSVMLLFWIALSHSKIGFISAVLAVFIMYIMNGGFSKSFSRLVLVGGLLLVALSYHKEIVVYLNSSFDLPLLRWLEMVLVDEEESYTVETRLDQIYITMDWIKSNNWLLGVGSERNSHYLLESWIAEYLFRYGYIGISLFIFFMIYLFSISYRSFLYFRTKNEIIAALSMAGAVWVVISPLILLSAMMMDRSKTGLAACLMIALILSLPRYKKQYLKERFSGFV